MRPSVVVPMIATISVAAAFLGGCGGSTSKAKSHEPSQEVLAQCMRAHGIRNFPDPTVGAGGQLGMSVQSALNSSTVTVEGISFSGPKFTAAENACKMFGGRDGHNGVSATRKASFLLQAQCMRDHGVPNFPDPKFMPGGGIRIDDSDINENAPAFVKAANECLHVGTPLPGGG
jgi:hypothetical protein